MRLKIEGCLRGHRTLPRIYARRARTDAHHTAWHQREITSANIALSSRLLSPSTTTMAPRSYSKTYSVPRRPFESARLYVIPHGH